MGLGFSLTLITANATLAIEFNVLSEKTPELEKTAFIDDRILDSGSLQQLTEAISEVAEMDSMMGHSTNIDVSKILRTANKVESRGMKLNLAHDFKLLGRRCIGVHKYNTADAQEATERSESRHCQLGRREYFGCLKRQQ